MPLTISGAQIQYLPDMTMGCYLKEKLVPAFDLQTTEDTALARIHTRDLRVVFNNDLRDRKLGALLKDGEELVISPWPPDPSTRGSLVGNMA